VILKIAVGFTQSTREPRGEKTYVVYDRHPIVETKKTREIESFLCFSSGSSGALCSTEFSRVIGSNARRLAEDSNSDSLPQGQKLTFPLGKDSGMENPIVIDQDILSGDPVFAGTRVPIQALFDNLEDGMSISEFMENYPSVSNEMVVNVLELAAKKLRVA